MYGLVVDIGRSLCDIDAMIQQCCSRLFGSGILVYVYGIFLPDGRCAYVGQTVYPVNREGGHRCRFKDYVTSGARMIILCVTTPNSANVIERAMIAEYRAKGGCWHNKSNGNNDKPRKFKTGRRVRCALTGIEFDSTAAMSRFMGCSGATAARYATDGYRVQRLSDRQYFQFQYVIDGNSEHKRKVGFATLGHS